MHNAHEVQGNRIVRIMLQQGLDKPIGVLKLVFLDQFKDGFLYFFYLLVCQRCQLSVAFRYGKLVFISRSIACM
jgi:hypothetical protein